jgi:hypothetical protein
MVLEVQAARGCYRYPLTSGNATLLSHSEILFPGAQLLPSMWV